LAAIDVQGNPNRRVGASPEKIPTQNGANGAPMQTILDHAVDL
jgi:hypothetical protein